MTIRVAVLMGGWSAEREVSLTSGRAVAAALEEAGYRVTPIDVPQDARALVDLLTPRPDVAFNALHGRGGEDGVIQGVLELLEIPFTHSGVLASAIAMDKPMTKRVLETVGVRSPKGVTLTREAVNERDPLPRPYVVKPVNEGSTVGVVLVREGRNGPVLGEEWRHGQVVLVEEYIRGRELTVGVMGGRPLAVTEIVFESAIFDYTAKYTAGHARHVIPADLPEKIYGEAMRVAALVHETLGCRGVSRSDFRWDDTRPGTEGLFFLEVNTQPGMTPLSLVPEQAAFIGMSYRDLVGWMVEDALCRG